MAPVLLANIWRSAADTDITSIRVYALVDHGGAAGLSSELRRHPSLRWHSLFDGSKEAGALEAAPILVELGFVAGEPTVHAKVFAGWLERNCSHSNALLCLHSTWAPEQVAQALKARIDAVLPGDMPVMLRYFDTRILEPLLAALETDQVRAFLGVGSQWLWFDRRGHLRSRSSTQLDTDTWRAPLALTDAQEASLLEAAEPDAVIALMQQAAPDLCTPQDPERLHALVSCTLPVARQYGVTDARQLAIFCITELECGPCFHERGPWKDALPLIEKEGVSFSALLHRLEGHAC